MWNEMLNVLSKRWMCNFDFKMKGKANYVRHLMPEDTLSHDFLSENRKVHSRDWAGVMEGRPGYLVV